MVITIRSGNDNNFSGHRAYSRRLLLNLLNTLDGIGSIRKGEMFNL